MSNLNEQENLEAKLRNIKIFWTLLLLFSLLLLVIMFIVSLISLFPQPPETEITPGIETIHKSLSIDSIIIGSALFLFGIIFLVTTTGFANSYHADKIVTPLFRDSNIIKSGTLTGIVKFQNKVEIEIQWSKKGYFVLTKENEPVAFAKSTELHWKLLYVSHKLNN